MQIDMDGFSVTLIRKSIKNLNLRINADGEVKLSAPNKFPLPLIHAFLQDKMDWIKSNQVRLRLQQISAPEESVEKLYPYLGEFYPLEKHLSSGRSKLVIVDRSLLFWGKKEITEEEFQRVLNSWYRQQLSAILPSLIKKWEEIIQVQAHEYRIKTMKTRWGTCNPKAKRIWLNLNLIQKPLGCLECVLVHEMTHLLEPSHNKRFYALMGQFMPDWKHHQKQLEHKITYYS